MNSLRTGYVKISPCVLFIALCLFCFVEIPFDWKTTAMVFLHNSEVVSGLDHDFLFLRSRAGCQDLVISLSLKNLCQDIRLG